jgi:hypothetical protein
MKLYRSKIPVIAHEAIERLVTDGDIEVSHERRGEAEADLSAIMEDYLRRDMGLREQIRDYMSDNGIPYSDRGRVRSRMADQRGHPLGDDVERYLVRQFTELLMITPNVEEVFGEDRDIYKKLMEVVRGHHVDEQAIREEARGKIKNIREGTVEFEIAMRKAVIEVKKRKGLIS